MSWLSVAVDVDELVGFAAGVDVVKVEFLMTMAQPGAICQKAGATVRCVSASSTATEALANFCLRCHCDIDARVSLKISSGHPGQGCARPSAKQKPAPPQGRLA